MIDLYSNMYTQSKSMIRFKGYALLNFEETDKGVGYLKLTDEKLREVLTEEEYDLIAQKDKKQSSKVKVKFKIVEILDQIL